MRRGHLHAHPADVLAVGAGAGEARGAAIWVDDADGPLVLVPIGDWVAAEDALRHIAAHPFPEWDPRLRLAYATALAQLTVETIEESDAPPPPLDFGRSVTSGE